MNCLEGMIRDRGYGGVESTGMECVRISDMRPKEEFREGYMVKCPGVRMCNLGQVMVVDMDERLAKVAWYSGLQGYWYLKDLVVVGYPTNIARRIERVSSKVQDESWL